MAKLRSLSGKDLPQLAGLRYIPETDLWNHFYTD